MLPSDSLTNEETETVVQHHCSPRVHFANRLSIRYNRERQNMSEFQHKKSISLPKAEDLPKIECYRSQFLKQKKKSLLYRKCDLMSKKLMVLDEVSQQQPKQLRRFQMMLKNMISMRKKYGIQVTQPQPNNNNRQNIHKRKMKEYVKKVAVKKKEQQLKKQQRSAHHLVIKTELELLPKVVSTKKSKIKIIVDQKMTQKKQQEQLPSSTMKFICEDRALQDSFPLKHAVQLQRRRELYNRSTQAPRKMDSICDKISGWSRISHYEEV